MRFLLLAAILPSILLIVFIYKQDKIEKEPPKLLAKLFIFGALTVLSAVALETAGGWLLGVLPEESVAYIFLENFLVVALAEELGKYAVLRLFTWKSPYFNYTFDAVVYAVIVSLGFATVENIMYVFEDGSFQIALMRGVLSVPGHAIDAVFMGYFYGLAKLAASRGNLPGSKTNLALALIVPVLTHGFYDFCLSMESGFFIALFYAFEIGVTVYAFFKVRKLSREDTVLTEDGVAPGAQDPVQPYGAQPPAGYPGAQNTGAPYGTRNTGYGYGAQPRTGYPGTQPPAQPNGYQQNPGGYRQTPGGYQQNPGGYQQYPGGYQQNPGGYQQNPGAYQQNPGGYQQPPESHPQNQTPPYGAQDPNR